MTDFYRSIRAVEDRLESFVTDNHFLSREESKDGGLANSSITNDDDGLGASWIFRNTTDSLFDHLFDFKQIERTFHSNNYDYTTPNDQIVNSS